MVIAELLAIVLTLNRPGDWQTMFAYLGNVSLFIQGITLSDAALLCYGKRWFYRLNPVPMCVVIYVLLQAVTIVFTSVHLLALPDSLSDRAFAGSDAGLPEVLIRNVLISAIITAGVMRYFYLRYQNTIRERTENEARVQALQARIRPHFLFNSLNTIANLIHTQPDKAEDAVVDLAELFRSTLADKVHISLAEELALSRRYLSMELLRLSDRLQIDWKIPKSLESLQLPALVLQPLIENAIYHGIEPLPNGGTITISAELTNSHVDIAVRNPVAASRPPQRSTGNHVAIQNIRQRLSLAYGSSAGLNIDVSDQYYTVTLSLPHERVPT